MRKKVTPHLHVSFAEGEKCVRSNSPCAASRTLPLHKCALWGIQAKTCHAFVVCMCVPSRSSHGDPTIYRNCDCRSSPAGVPGLASPWAHDAAVPAVPAVFLESMERGGSQVRPHYTHSTGMGGRNVSLYHTIS